MAVRGRFLDGSGSRWEPSVWNLCEGMCADSVRKPGSCGRGTRCDFAESGEPGGRQAGTCV